MKSSWNAAYYLCKLQKLLVWESEQFSYSFDSSFTTYSQILSMIFPSLSITFSLFITPSPSCLTSLLPFTFYVHCRQQQKFSFFYFSFLLFLVYFACKLRLALEPKVKGEFRGADDVIPCRCVHHHIEHNYDHSEHSCRHLSFDIQPQKTFEQHKVNATARIMLVRMQPQKG